jgi:hypothetical protein
MSVTDGDLVDRTEKAFGCRLGRRRSGAAAAAWPSSMPSAAPLSRSGAAGGMLAAARLTGQTIGAILAAILFGLPAIQKRGCFGGSNEAELQGPRSRMLPKEFA